MRPHKKFWNKEYEKPKHLSLSTEPSEDLQKFTRWLTREYGKEFLNVYTNVLDLGCGNGRNIVYLAREFGVKGIGYDISETAIQQAKEMTGELPLAYEVRSIKDLLPLPDASITIVLDMMVSHFLKAAEREQLRNEIARVLKPGGWLFFKSFLADEDLHTKRLLREHPADEPGAYIHPEFGAYEYVYSEAAMEEFFSSHFDIRKIERSHRHLNRGKAGKRRTIVVYMQKA